MAESMLIGASLINIFIAVWLVNARLYPMTVALMPLLMHENQPNGNIIYHVILLLSHHG